jgi:hypothetical protein
MFLHISKTIWMKNSKLCHHSLVGVKPFAYVFWNHGLFEKNQLKEDHPPFNFNTFSHINYLSSSLISLGFEQVWHSLLALIRQLHNCFNVIWSLKRSERSSYFLSWLLFFVKKFRSHEEILTSDLSLLDNL